MTLDEFKAWFDGFTEDMHGTPNTKQWTRIKARIAEINSTVTTKEIYINKWVNPYKDWFDGDWHTFPDRPFGPNIVYCMNSAGKAEYKSIG